MSFPLALMLSPHPEEASPLTAEGFAAWEQAGLTGQHLPPGREFSEGFRGGQKQSLPRASELVHMQVVPSPKHFKPGMSFLKST